jgi:hypothetical protein
MVCARVWSARVLLVAFLVLAGFGPAQPVGAAQWVQNFVATELWSGPDVGAISFGTAPQWDYFEVVSTHGTRTYVRVARSQNFAFVDSATLGPAGPPPVGWPGSAPVVAAPAAPPAAPAAPSAPPRPGTVPPPPGASQAVIGPVPGFAISADRGLWPALQTLQRIQHSWTLQALAASGTQIEWGLMPPDAAGMYQPERQQITINIRWANSDPRALAAVIEHEAKHVADMLAGLDVNSPGGCIETEINAFREEAKTWGELVGPNGKPNPKDDLEYSLNFKLQLYQQNPNAIPTLILQSPGYRLQCRL